jgi:hypothetical protein
VISFDERKTTTLQEKALWVLWLSENRPVTTVQHDYKWQHPEMVEEVL